MKKLLFVFMLVLCTGMNLILAQNKIASGTITSSEDGQPVIGAAVMISGTMTGTITDVNGHYELEVPDGTSTLVVSCLGMLTKEISVGQGSNVVLDPDNNVLNEVVVTAMGITRERKSLGYALQEVSSDQLTQAGSPSVTSALSGKIAGVQVNTFGGYLGASSRISVRGNSSLAADQQPLIVVDGVPVANDTQRSGDDTYNGVDYGSGLNDINPEDIESISVLKGGSAALYGMRAGNGVILITTKSGSKAANGITIQYDGSLTIDRVTNIPKLQNKYGQGYDGDEYHYGLYGDGLSYQDYADQYVFHYVDGKGSGVYDTMDESWGARLDAGLKLVQFDSNGEYADWVSHPDNVRDFFQTGVTQNHTVSILNRSAKGSTRVSLSYRDQRGTVPNTDQERYSGQVNTKMALNDKVSYDLSATFTRTESSNLLRQGYTNNPMNSLLLWAGRQIDMASLKANWDQKDAQGDYTLYNWNNLYNLNPYFAVNENTNSYYRDRIIAKTSLYYQPFTWLKFEGRVGYDYYDAQSFERHYYDPNDYPEGGFEQTSTKNSELNADLLATFNKTWGDLNVTGLLGANYRNVNWETNTLGATSLTIPGVYTLSNKVGDAVATMDHSHIRSNSVYANVSLGYKGQVYLDASARNDWSSTIKDDFFYPSVSLSWIPTETFPQLKGKVLSFWKIRGGLAQVGSATYAYRNSYYYYAESSYASSHNGVALMHKSYSYPNTDLKPEKVTSWEIGTEVGFIDDRIHLDVAYYQKRTEDQILSVSTSNVVGFSSMLVNAGRIDNKGIEIQLKGDILRNPQGFNWSSTLNFSKDRSKVVSLYPGLDRYMMGWTWGIGTYANVGDQWGDLIGTAHARVTQEDVDAGKATSDQIGAIKLNSSGYPYTESSSVIGNVTPDFLMGWSNDFTFKNLTFGFMLDLRIGGDIWSQSMAHGYTAGTAEYTATGDIRERAIVAGVDVMKSNDYVREDANGNWVTNDIETDAQTWFESYGIDEDYVFKGSFLKLREAYITYKVPKKFIDRIGFIKAASVSLVGNNLWLIWVDKSNTLRLDPEAGGVASDSYGIGFEQASVPGSRSIGFKVGLTF